MLDKLIKLIKERLFPPSVVSVSVTKAIVAGGSTHEAGDYLNGTDVLAWKFSNMAKENGGSVELVNAKIHTEVEAQSHRIALQVFTLEPTATLTDDAAAASPNVVDEKFFEDEILLPALSARGDGSYAVATPSTVGNLPLIVTCEPDSRDIFLVPITLDATTHTAGEDMTVTLKGVQIKTARD